MFVRQVSIARDDALGTDLPGKVDEVVVVGVAQCRTALLRVGLGSTNSGDLLQEFVDLGQGEEPAKAWSPQHLVNLGQPARPGFSTARHPWLYTALMTNFGFVYQHFGTTYYASRLPAILPGYFLNSFLTPEQAYVVLHTVFFLAGALFLYLLVRTLFGVRVAVLVYRPS